MSSFSFPSKKKQNKKKKQYNIEGEKVCSFSVRFTKSVMKAADLKCISCHLLSLSLTVQYLLIF